MNQSSSQVALTPRELRQSDPIFIVGCPRSGTTLLASIFDRHSQMAVTPESIFFRHFWKFRLGGRERYPADKLVQLFTEGRYTRELQLDPAVLSEYVGTGEISVMEFFRTAVNLFAHLKGKPRCAEKTGIHLMYVPEIFKYFPEARVICIYRDGRDCALSLGKIEYAVPALLRGYSSVWREYAATMLKYQEQFPDRFRSVQYESLLAQPTEVMTSLMQYVGLEFEPEQLDPSRTTGVCTDWDFPQKKNVFSEIDPKRAYAWKRTAKPGELRVMNSMMRPYLGRLGYEPGDENRGILPVRVYDAAMNAVFRMAFATHLAEWRRLSRYVLRPFVGSSPHIMPLKSLGKRQQQQPDFENDKTLLPR